MHGFVTYRRCAEQCASLRDRARSEIGRARLEREWADWLDLAREAGREPRTFVARPGRVR